MRNLNKNSAGYMNFTLKNIFYDAIFEILLYTEINENLKKGYFQQKHLKLWQHF